MKLIATEKPILKPKTKKQKKLNQMMMVCFSSFINSKINVLLEKKKILLVPIKRGKRRVVPRMKVMMIINPVFLF